MNILELVERETHLSFARRGREHHGPCPFCRCEGKQFIVFTTGEGAGRYWCRQCGAKGDAIEFLKVYKHLSFRQAKEYLGLRGDIGDNFIHHNHHNHQNNLIHHNHPFDPPSDAWTEAATPFVAKCEAALWSDVGSKALSWLHGRGLSDETTRRAGLGYNETDHYADRQAWGLPPETTEQGRAKGLWLPRGITIPWQVDGALWGVRVRRPVGDPKYYWLPGGTANALYGADALSPGKAAMILEGEIDALTVQQWAGDLVTPVATGSTHAARRAKWLGRLAIAPTVLVAYDSDEAGEAAAGYWTDALQAARRWRPYWSDANDMAQDGVNVRAWVQAGLPIAMPEAATPEPAATQAARALVGPLLGEPGWEDGDMAAVVGAMVAGDVYEVLRASLPEGWAYRATETLTGWHVHGLKVSA